MANMGRYNNIWVDYWGNKKPVDFKELKEILDETTDGVNEEDRKED